LVGLWTSEALEGRAPRLADSRQLDHALAAWEALIAARPQALGDGHHHTLKSRLDRAGLDLARGRSDTAVAAERALVDDCPAQLGPQGSKP
jgi:hypothetical protein